MTAAPKALRRISRTVFTSRRSPHPWIPAEVLAVANLPTCAFGRDHYRRNASFSDRLMLQTADVAISQA
jgi:hypothetical protein